MSNSFDAHAAVRWDPSHYMYSDIYIYVYICIYPNIHTHLYTHTYIYIHIYISKSMYTGNIIDAHVAARWGPSRLPPAPKWSRTGGGRSINPRAATTVVRWMYWKKSTNLFARLFWGGLTESDSFLFGGMNHFVEEGQKRWILNHKCHVFKNSFHKGRLCICVCM